MFCKPFRVKSHTALKSSDRKKLRGAISSAFSSLTTENLADLMPSKEDLTVVKVFVHKGDAVSVYVHNKNPIIFELERRFYPTVYTLWRHPDILPVFSTWPPVFERMNGGADLMLPGVLVSSGLPEVQKGTLCAITLVGNRAPVAIGVATMSTKDMLASGMKGKGFNILHTYKDQLCPEGQQVDIKKSSYKKLSKFLQVMQQRNILQVKELSKGVESIVEIQWKHPDVISFVAPTTVLPLETCETSDGGRKQSYQPPEISSLYGINAKMLPLFQASGHRKGDLLTHNEVRSVTITYVKTNELVHSDKNFVIVDPVICDCLLNASEKHDLSLLKWDDLLTRCLERMQPSHRVTFPGISSVVRKGNIEPIDIAVAQRGSNKKVTIIKNLELYGLDPLSVGSALQQRVQASFSCTVLPGTKDRVQVQIQGNQVSQAGKLLLDYFKIPRKYISGLDLAVKAGKKK
ncbi:PREDICTED: eukaryotic translation initiation factor 2D isoform X2 [Nanorana parkeri]|uniref:eukaryotic translation initiation factor 2D isoform X2 n=1 Tax=Nanorana parkeri TaxID=125878 RepID=UPI000854FC35|nr:PREDICTED: eukaryotic translation initiation factor 2D isoform X2 [Nanorana parkeri]